MKRMILFLLSFSGLSFGAAAQKIMPFAAVSERPTFSLTNADTLLFIICYTSVGAFVLWLLFTCGVWLKVQSLGNHKLGIR